MSNHISGNTEIDDTGITLGELLNKVNNLNTIVTNLMRSLKVYTVESNSTSSIPTGINVNQGNAGGTILAMHTVNGSDGNYTSSQIDMIRCGYNGNNYAVVNMARSTYNSPVVEYSIDSSGNLMQKKTQGNVVSKYLLLT